MGDFPKYSSVRRHHNPKLGVGGVNCTCCRRGSKSDEKARVSRNARRKSRQTIRTVEV
jgi:hypothetical protein